MISGKGVALLQNILKSNGKKSIKKLSNEFELSERTIRYEIKKIEEVFNYKYNLKDKPNIELKKGILYLNNIELVKKILSETYDLNLLSIEERELYILSKILYVRAINLSQLSKNLDVSRNTLKIYLKKIKNQLEKYNLKLETNSKIGLILIGNEENIRLCALNFFRNLKNSKNYLFKNIIKKEMDIDDKNIIAFINYCQKLMKRIISDEAYEIIKIYLKIVIIMTRDKNIIKKIKNEVFLEKTDEYKAILKAGAILEANYDIELSKVEYLKITDFFLGSHTYNKKYSYFDNWVEMEFLVKKLIYKFEKLIDVVISQDDILLDTLVNHLKPTIYRIQNKIKLENSIYLEVVKSYPVLFLKTKEVMNELENYFEIEFSNDEIAFITIYFKSSMDRNRVVSKNKKRVLLVCGLGYGTSNFLAEQLRELFSIEIIDIIPRHILSKKINKNNLDLIITTISLEDLELKVPSIKVNAILSEEDKEKLKLNGLKKRGKKYLLSEFITEIEKNCTINDRLNLYNSLKNILGSNLINDILSKKITIFDMLKRNSVILGEVAKDWEDAVKKAGRLLVNTNCVDKSYIDEMINIIKKYGSYMVMGNNIAFTHSKNDNNVKKTGFSIVTLKKSIYFPGNIPVKTIVAFCSKDNKEHLDGFLELVEIMENPNFNIEKFVKKLCIK